MTNIMIIEIVLVVVLLYFVGIYLLWSMIFGLIPILASHLKDVLLRFFRPLPTPAKGVDDGECHTSMPSTRKVNDET